MAAGYPAGECAMSHRQNYLECIFGTWVHCIQMTSTLSRSQSSSTLSECGGDSQIGCAADKLCVIISIRTKTSEEFSTTCSIKNFKSIGPQGVSNKMSNECLLVILIYE